MSDNSSFENYPKAILLAEPDPLAVSTVRFLIDSFCRVEIFTAEPGLWQHRVAGFLNKKLVGAHSVADLAEEERADYALFFSKVHAKRISATPDAVLTEELGRIKIFSKYLAQAMMKHAFVLPFYAESSDIAFSDQVLSEIKKNVSAANIVFTSEVLGEGVELNLAVALDRIFATAINREPIEVNQESTFFPMDAGFAANELVKDVFTFGSADRVLWVSGPQVSGVQVANLLKKIEPGLKLVLVTKAAEPVKLPAARHVTLPTNIEELFRKTYATGKVLGDVKVQKVEPVAKPVHREIPVRKDIVRPVERRSFGRVAARGVSALLAFLLFLLALLVANATFLYRGLLVFKAGGTSVAKTYFTMAKDLGSVQEVVWTPVAYLPGLSWGRRVAGVFRKSGEIGVRAAEVTERLSALTQNITQEKDANLAAESREASLELDVIYRELGFLEGELNQLQPSGAPFAALIKAVCPGGFLSKQGKCADLSEPREMTLLARNAVELLPAALGVGGEKTYLLLFQNNMELRPTGGFIGSFGLAKFDGGKLVDFQVLDVYSADGQLKGHVEPPVPIKKYLGEAGWYLRDSNWDPDFPTSAQRAEWFLEKELNLSVDGVVGIDMEVAKKIIAVLGSVKLRDFDRTVDATNLYEITQAEAERDFFPGSRRKADFLAALSDTIAQEVIQSRPPSRTKLAVSMLESAREKHLLFYFNDQTLQSAVAKLKLDGGVAFTGCGLRCVADGLLMVEANVGVNKADYFIKRSAELTVDLKEEAITRMLVVTLKNSANPALGDKGRYKAYLRIFAPEAVNFQPAKIEVNREVNEAPVDLEDGPGVRSAGVFMEVLPGQEVKATFNWSSPQLLSAANTYRLFWQKQAGTGSDNIKVRFRGLAGLKVVGNPPFSLTQAGSVGYNTNLLTDFSAQVGW